MKKVDKRQTNVQNSYFTRNILATDGCFPLKSSSRWSSCKRCGKASQAVAMRRSTGTMWVPPSGSAPGDVFRQESARMHCNILKPFHTWWVWQSFVCSSQLHVHIFVVSPTVILFLQTDSLFSNENSRRTFPTRSAVNFETNDLAGEIINLHARSYDTTAVFFTVFS